VQSLFLLPYWSQTDYKDVSWAIHFLQVSYTIKKYKTDTPFTAKRVNNVIVSYNKHNHFIKYLYTLKASRQPIYQLKGATAGTEVLAFIHLLALSFLENTIKGNVALYFYEPSIPINTVSHTSILKKTASIKLLFGFDASYIL